MSGYDLPLAQTFVSVRDDRRFTVFPRLVERIGELAPKGHLLDYGGGDGEFAMTAASLPLNLVVTFDPSPAMTALAAARCESEPRISAIDSSSGLDGATFDVVTCNGVWMCWTSEDDCVDNLMRIGRLLRAGGTMLASVTHPCFRDRLFATYRTDFDPARYLDDGSRFHVRVFDGEREVELEDTHWSLGAMTRQLGEAGLRLVRISEVADRSGAVGCPWMIVEATSGS